MSTTDKKHLTHHDRANLVGYLQMNVSIYNIARRLNKSPSTIYRELKRNVVTKEGISSKPCTCIKKYLVCNRCPNKTNCTKDKIYYSLEAAIKDASIKKHNSHSGPRIKYSEFKIIDKIITDGVRKGQSLEHIYHFNKDNINVSLITIRRWINRGYMTIKRAQLKRARRYTKKYAYNHEKDAGYQINSNILKLEKTYSDYMKFKESNDVYLMELDSVEGNKKSKYRLFTFMFVNERFQLGRKYLISEAKDAVLNEVEQIVNVILSTIKDKEIVLLADNGTEFSTLPLIERLDKRIHVFYTNPYRSTDKAHCERNHEYFRYVCPKGYSFDSFTQEEINNIFSNINSYSRKELKWKSPYNLFIEAYSSNVASSLGIKYIPSNEVNLASRF